MLKTISTDERLIALERKAYKTFCDSDKQPNDYRIFARRLTVLALKLERMDKLKAAWLEHSEMYTRIASQVEAMEDWTPK